MEGVVVPVSGGGAVGVGTLARRRASIGVPSGTLPPAPPPSRDGVLVASSRRSVAGPEQFPSSPCPNDNGPKGVHRPRSRVPLRCPIVVRCLCGPVGPTTVFQILPPSILLLSSLSLCSQRETPHQERGVDRPAPPHDTTPPPPSPTLEDNCDSFRMCQNSLLDELAEGSPSTPP